MNTKSNCKPRGVETGFERIPSLTIIGDSGLPGNFYLSFISVPAIIQLDGSGNLVWADEAPAKAEPLPESYTIPDGQEFPDGRGWWDFKKTIGTDGKVYCNCHAKVDDANNYSVSGYHPGKRVILPEDYIDRKELNLLTDPDCKCLTLLPDNEYPNYGIDQDNYVDGHDFLLFTPDHYILSSYRFDQDSNSVYSYLQEVEEGKVVWRWSSILYENLSAFTSDSSKAEEPYTDVVDSVHFNSMCLDSDGNLICSFRHVDTIMKISRGKNAPSGVGEIIWQLSGDKDEFGLTEEQKTDHQHYVRREDDYGRTIEQNDIGGACVGGVTKLTCFDNQNTSRKTRLVRYEIDQNAKTCVAFDGKEIYKKYSSACGSVQYIGNGICVVGWGKAECELITDERDCMTVYDFKKEVQEQELMTVVLNSHRGYNFTYRCVYSD